jgi:hypothetical protein
VTDGTNDYILSNSHVLAREGAGIVGEDIMHTVSSACSNNALHIGELAADVPLGFGRRNTNLVDAAVAGLRPTSNPPPMVPDGFFISAMTLQMPMRSRQRRSPHRLASA